MINCSLLSTSYCSGLIAYVCFSSNLLVTTAWQHRLSTTRKTDIQRQINEKDLCQVLLSIVVLRCSASCTWTPISSRGHLWSGTSSHRYFWTALKLGLEIFLKVTCQFLPFQAVFDIRKASKRRTHFICTFLWHFFTKILPRDKSHCVTKLLYVDKHVTSAQYPMTNIYNSINFEK